MPRCNECLEDVEYLPDDNYCEHCLDDFERLHEANKPKHIGTIESTFTDKRK